MKRTDMNDATFFNYQTSKHETNKFIMKVINMKLIKLLN